MNTTGDWSIAQHVTLLFAALELVGRLVLRRAQDRSG